MGYTHDGYHEQVGGRTLPKPRAGLKQLGLVF